MTKPTFHSSLIAVLILWTGCDGGARHDGTQGAASITDSAGTTGNAGTTGSAGTTGNASTTGTGGTTSNAGATVDAGATDSAGTMGTAGTTGPGGTTGSGGTTGTAGTTGSAGTPAGAGTMGSSGNSAEAGSGGSVDTGGSGGMDGAAGTSGDAGSGGSAGGAGGAGCFDGGAPSFGGSDAVAGAGGVATELFSFFVTSQDAMIELSGNELGFGGDLRFGETGPGAGLRGADKICTTIAETSMPGAGAKGWRAFLSATTDGSCGGGRVDAVDRVGSGPWYDRLGRLVAENPEALLMDRRPEGADPAIANDLPDEYGVPNHCASGTCQDNHDTLTGFVPPERDVQLTDTCEDWTSVVPDIADPVVGHSWASQAIPSWFEAHRNQGCAPGGTLVEELPSTMTVGSGGGYGGIYCFALVP